MPIREARLSKGVKTNISYDATFEGWQAAIAAGASLDELYKWESWAYPRAFMAKVVAWYRTSTLVKAHQEDAVAASVKSKGK